VWESALTVQHVAKLYVAFTTPAPAVPAFGGPNLVSPIPDTAVFVGGSKTFNVASHFNATKSPGSAFKYFVTTNNHALLEVSNASQDLGTFELKSLNTSGNATVTVKVVAVERDVDVWVATSTFAVSVGNNAPTLEVALPDVTGTQNFSLSEYFKDDHGQLTYSLSVEDPNVVNATLVGSTLYVQNGLFLDGHSLVTVTASDGFANVSSALNATYSFATVSFQFQTEYVYEITAVGPLVKYGVATTSNAVPRFVQIEAFDVDSNQIDYQTLETGSSELTWASSSMPTAGTTRMNDGEPGTQWFLHNVFGYLNLKENDERALFSLSLSKKANNIIIYSKGGDGQYEDWKVKENGVSVRTVISINAGVGGSGVAR
jgi:hypothetical protein